MSSDKNLKKTAALLRKSFLTFGKMSVFLKGR